MGSAKKYWVKFWIDILDDPKVQILPDRLWRRMSELILIAGRNDSGLLPPVEEIAWILRLDPEELEKDLKELSKAGGKGREILIFQKKQWILKNYEKRQSPAPAKVRMQRYRDNKEMKALQERNEEGYDFVSEDVPETDTETDTETDPETERSLSLWASAEMRLLLENKYELNKAQMDQMKLIVSEFPEKKVISFLKWAAIKGMTAGEMLIASRTALPHWVEELPPGINSNPKRTVEYYSRKK